MTAKEEFVKAFESKVGKRPQEFKGSVKEFCKVLNEDAELREMFRDAVAEAKKGTLEEQTAQGLAQLFSTS